MRRLSGVGGWHCGSVGQAAPPPPSYWETQTSTELMNHTQETTASNLIGRPGHYSQKVGGVAFITDVDKVFIWTSQLRTTPWPSANCKALWVL